MNRLMCAMALVSWSLPIAAMGNDELDACRAHVQSAPAKAIDECTRALDSRQLTGAQRQFAFRLRGIAHEAKREVDPAIADFDEALRRDPKDYAALNDRGNAWFDKHEFAKAIADYDEATRIDPQQSGPYMNRANVLRFQQQWGQAKTQYDEAIRIDPQLATAFYDRGLTWTAMKDDDKAIADFDQAIGLRPGNVSFLLARGNANARRHAFDKAIADFDSAVHLDPLSTRALAGRARTRRAMGECDKAVADYDAVLRIEPNAAWALASRGSARMCLHERDAAIADVEAALRIEPTANRQRELGGYRFDAGDYDGSVRDLRLAVEPTPHNAYAAVWLYLAHTRSTHPDGALAELVANTSGNGDAAWPAPVVGLYLGRVSPADLLVAAHDADPNKDIAQVCEANFYLAEWHLAKNDRTVARPLLQAARRDCPTTFYEREMAIAELSRLSP